MLPDSAISGSGALWWGYIYLVGCTYPTLHHITCLDLIELERGIRDVDLQE